MPTYHFVFTTKYRRPILVDRDVKLSLGSIFRTLCEQAGWEIVAFETMPDHVHLLATVQSNVAPSQVANRLKGVSSRELRKHYHALKVSMRKALWGARFWCEGVGHTDRETIRRYIDNQEEAFKRKAI